MTEIEGRRGGGGTHVHSDSRTQLLMPGRSFDRTDVVLESPLAGAPEVEMGQTADIRTAVEALRTEGFDPSRGNHPGGGEDRDRSGAAEAGAGDVKLGNEILHGLPDKNSERNEILSMLPKHKQVAVSFVNVRAWANCGLPTQGGLSMLAEWLKWMKGSQGEEQGGNPTDVHESGVAAEEASGNGSEERKQILCGVTASVAPGELFALMGPSGSGKTSLVTIIGGRKPGMIDVEGHILFNGQELDKMTKRKIGFVLQDDLLFESLTVEETLFYAALLRLPKAMSRPLKKERVQQVISTLGLNKCRNTLIGGFTHRGISGGERKRVSIGHELLIDPSVIILDEPTSGLDSTTAMHILTLLRKFAEGGRSVLTTIHQPSSRMYQQLDKVMLLSEGCSMYYGKADLVVDWFANLGFNCPTRVNVADFMLDLSIGDMAIDESFTEDTRQRLVASFDKFKASHLRGLTSKSELPDKSCVEGASLHDSSSSSSQHIPSTSSASLTGVRGLNTTQKSKEDRWGADFGEQVEILFWRCVQTRRLDSYSWQRFANLLVVAVIAGLLWWQRGGKSTLLSAADVSGLLFFEMIFMSFFALFIALFTFPSDHRMLLKERASGMYRLSAFYISRTLSDLPMDCFIPTLFVIIVYWFGGLRSDGGAFISNWLSLLLVTLVAQSYGLLIGAAVTNMQTAQTVAAIVMLTFMLTGGYFVRDVPVWADWLKYLSFIWWTFNLMLKIEFNGREFEDCGGLGNEEETSDCEPVKDLDDSLTLDTDVEDSVWPEVLWLVLKLVAIRFIIYLVLRRKTMS